MIVKAAAMLSEGSEWEERYVPDYTACPRREMVLSRPANSFPMEPAIQCYTVSHTVIREMVLHHPANSFPMEPAIQCYTVILFQFIDVFIWQKRPSDFIFWQFLSVNLESAVQIYSVPPWPGNHTPTGIPNTTFFILATILSTVQY